MFGFLAVELSVLFIGISLLVGVLQRHIPPSKVEALLSSNRRRGYFLAAALGAITPFCSCSTIPMLKGLIRARAGFGPMMVFLFASPLLNPIIVVLLAGHLRIDAHRHLRARGFCGLSGRRMVAARAWL
ncbi:MAG: permease [Woeseiaceae bacterium]|nr:permease [Woeseiaceae bacterium]